MAPLRRHDRAERRRARPGLRPLREDLEPRVVLTSSGLRSGLTGATVLSGSIAPMATVAPAGGSGSPSGYTPQQIRTAYGFDRIMFGSVVGDGSGQTIAIVDAYDHPGLVNSSSPDFSTSDLAQFDRQFGLPDPPSFIKLNQAGQTSPLPGTDPLGPGHPGGNWEYEEAMDVEWAHALAPAASIVLVEANSGGLGDLYSAINIAAHLPGVSVVSLSWGGPEYQGENYWDQNYQTPDGHQGVTFVAASGDNGAPGIYPAYSRNVLAVGGTELRLGDDGSIQSETAWSGSGGGISAYEPEPSYQQGVQDTGYRTIPDVAFDASNATGVAVYDSYNNPEGSPWVTMWGTSLGAPAWSALIAIANQGRVLAGASTLDGGTQTLPALYSLPSADFHDITSGGNGTYDAGPGYDEVTGLGSPVADRLALDLAFYGMSDHLAITAQPGSSMTAGQPFDLTVAIERPDGSIDAGAGGTLTISISSQPGGASLGGTLTATIDHGVATFAGLSIDRAGAGYSLAVDGGGFGSATSSSFVVTPAAASQLVIATQPPTTVAAGGSFGLSVDVEDAYGNLVTGFSGGVSLGLAGGPADGALAGTLSVAASGGVAAFAGLSIDRAGAGYAIAATANGLAGAATDPFGVTPSTPARLVIDAGPPPSVAAGAPFGLTVSVEDAYGNLEAGYDGVVNLELAGGPSGTMLIGPAIGTASGGVATFSGLQLTTAGPGYVLAVTGAGLDSASSSPFTVTPASASQLVIATQPPSATMAGNGFGLAVGVEDAFGNPVPDAQESVTLTLSGGPAGGILDGGREAGLSGGIATFSGLSIDQAAPDYAITATAPGLSPATTGRIGITPAAPSRLVLASGPSGNLIAGSGFGLTVDVEDAFGNLVPDAENTVSLTLMGGAAGTTLGGVTTASPSGGVAAFDGLTIDRVGSPFRIQASSPGLTGVTTGDLSVIPSAPAQLVIALQPPATVTAGDAFGLGVSIEDAFGNPATDYTGIVSVSIDRGPAGSNLSGTRSVAAEGGSAMLSGLALDRAGDDVILRVAADGLEGLATTPMRVVAAAPSQIVITAQPPGHTVAGRAFGLVATVEDRYGNVATDFGGTVTASLAGGPSGGSLDGPLSTSAVGGVARFGGLAIDRAGVGYAIQASAGGWSPAVSTSIAVVPAPASRLIITTQPPATAIARRPFAVAVEAVDAYGNLATDFGSTVFAALAANPNRNLLGGSLSVQAKGGRAGFGDLSLRKPGKSYTITITSSGLTPAVTSVFDVTRPRVGGALVNASRVSRFHVRRPSHPMGHSTRLAGSRHQGHPAANGKGPGGHGR